MNKRTLAFALAATLAFPILASADEIRQRAIEQQERIHAGLRSGQLTPREAHELERREARLDEEIATMRARNGGRLTLAQRARIDRQQDELSAAISHKRHN